MPHVTHQLSLIIPGLSTVLAKNDAEQPHTAELKLLLARSERISCAVNLDALLFDLFGYENNSAKNLPIAPLTYALDTNRNETGWLLRADPVYMRPDNDRVLMMGNAFMNISPSDADVLAHELCALFSSYGWKFSAPTPKRWYLRLPEDPGVFFHSLPEVLGHDVHHYLSDDMQNAERTKLWRRVLNEAQMVLHASPVNRAREARGELPVNSLWFWGSGALPPAAQPRFAQVSSNEVLSLSLTKHSGTPCSAATATAKTWLEQALISGEHLVFVEPGNTLEELNKNWLAPLFTALKAHQLSALDLYAGNGNLFRATPSSVGRWWKRPRSLNVYQ